MFVHLVGLLFGFPGSGTLYLYSKNRYERSGFAVSNCRNSLNWQLSLLIYFILLMSISFLVGVGQGLGIYSLNQAAVGLVTFLAMISLFSIDLLFSMTAFYMSIKGESWEYPLSLELVD